MKILGFFLAICWPALVAAQAPMQARTQAPTQAPPSTQAGQQLATSGAGGIAACATCHGAQGEGNAASGFPRLAGLPEYYLNKQLASFANGSRNNPIMTPIAKAMNAAQVRDVGAWYASLAAPSAPPVAAGPAVTMARGSMLAGVGDAAKGLQACANCHGPGGAGEAPVYPYLAGQHASYLTAAIGEWKSGARNTDASGQMPSIAKSLSDSDVAALAAYYSAQPAPPPAAKLVNVPAGSVARPALAARADAPGPRGATTAGQGVGTEQGAPITGGSQGPGGGGGTQGTQPQPPPPPPPPPPPIKK